MACFLALWSAAIITLILRRAISFDGHDDVGNEKDGQDENASALTTDLSIDAKEDTLQDTKGELVVPKEAPGGLNKGEHSKSIQFIAGSSGHVSSPLTRKLYVSEIMKVSSIT